MFGVIQILFLFILLAVKYSYFLKKVMLVYKKVKILYKNIFLKFHILFSIFCIIIKKNVIKSIIIISVQMR